jgi:hypothetical protein
MAWFVSLLSSALPDVWLAPALAAAGLWVYGWLAPGRIAAEVVRAGAVALVGVAVWLWVWSGATAACEARIAAATAAETERQRLIVGDALTQARAEGQAAMDDAAKARADLEAALDALDHQPDAPPSSCGLPKRWVGALPK